MPVDVLTYATEHPHFSLVDVKSRDVSYRWTKCKVDVPLVARKKKKVDVLTHATERLLFALVYVKSLDVSYR